MIIYLLVYKSLYTASSGSSVLPGDLMDPLQNISENLSRYVYQADVNSYSVDGSKIILDYIDDIHKFVILGAFFVIVGVFYSSNIHPFVMGDRFSNKLKWTSERVNNVLGMLSLAFCGFFGVLLIKNGLLNLFFSLTLILVFVISIITFIYSLILYIKQLISEYGKKIK